MSAAITSALKPVPAPDPSNYQGQPRKRVPSLASVAIIFGAVLLAASGTAKAQNADLNSNADTVGGIDAIPTDLPGSARTITGQPAAPSGPLDLLELAKQRRQAYQARADMPDSQAQDFPLSSQYRHSAGNRQGKAGTRRVAPNPDVIQASIMTSETGASETSPAWTKTQPVQSQPQAKPQGSLATPATTPAPGIRRTGNPLFAAPKPAPNGATTNSLPDAETTGADAPAPVPTQTQQQPSPAPAPVKAAQQRSIVPPPSPAGTGAGAPALSANGNYAVQLGAFRSAIGAETYWASFAIRYPQLAETYHHYLGTVDVAGKGQLHRLRMGGFASLAAAKEKCRQLQADGIDCIGLSK
ncbi:hypothetical protein TH25_10035 [Thalassospira profundimaris]|uniref:SPOR domain-containing protein n=1 Tax=Thalassospira profundimaris TaxID=502049 RepID=A0A367XC85_9PROT|nr:SPOR domain-containing protein [Thalassospira profundimaris]RCK51285.1 hypothetical protein TH25_10035 [Thalassospira profundimaris]